MMIVYQDLFKIIVAFFPFFRKFNQPGKAFGQETQKGEKSAQEQPEIQNKKHEKAHQTEAHCSSGQAEEQDETPPERSPDLLSACLLGKLNHKARAKQ